MHFPFPFQVLSYGRDWRVILLAPPLDPTAPLPALLLADYYLACEDPAAAAAAVKTAAKLASQAGGRVLTREKLYIQAFSAYVPYPFLFYLVPRGLALL